ncbi:hypothetical protein V5F53_02675 [Xanthobacter sp. V4C-4]|uniref:hypothetical protein n=1 Tax=Xanthobacter cornucopiae TaxID=3119924 RepID=UPI00372B32B4
MRRILFAAGLLAVASTSALALSQAEIDAAVGAIDVKDDTQCLANHGEKLVRKTEVKDLNGDGVDEIVLTVTGSEGGASCFGKYGNAITLLISDGAGKWREELGFGAAGITFLKRDDSAWPDIEIGMAGGCNPIWRIAPNGHYDIWKTCEGGRLVQAKAEQAASPAPAIGKLVPVEIYSGRLEGPPYSHNGSIVIIDADKGVIVYDRPKKAIADTIKPGTVLFKAKPWKSGDNEIIIKGTAYTFKAGCPAAAYEVSGRYHHLYGLNKLTLEGMAPVRSKTSCDIVGYTTTGANTKLVFDIAIE